ncbi:MAG TPA: hypothetical protein VFZ65_12735 [Planctomycetota bacterium]|nr:hypothetical protein [Planctomycetota bacterium]
MATRLALCLPFLAISASAQTDTTADTRPPQRAALSRNAGLQPDGPGRLLGGGEHYLVRLSAQGADFVPALGRSAPVTQHLHLRPLSAQRGSELVAGPFDAAPELVGLQATYHHTPGVEERYDVGIDGIEVSWCFHQRPAGSGDLVVRYAVDTNLPAATRGRDGGLEFAAPELGGVAIGGVTGVDANGVAVAGELRAENGTLELRLPSAFVDRATYPIVLDPLLGPIVNVAVSANDDAEPDTAYDRTTSSYLVTFLRSFSASLVLPRAQRVDTFGALVGGTIFLSSVGQCGRPRVANFPPRDRFGIVFAEHDGIFDGIQFRAVDAASGAITHAAVLASSTGVDLYTDPDIGADVDAPLITPLGFVAVFEDNIQNAIRARRVSFDAADMLVSPGPVDIFTDTGGIGAAYTEPAMSRAAGNDGRFLVAARRFSGIGPSLSVSVKVVQSSTLAVVATTSMPSSQTDAIEAPDADGYDGHWVAAWEQTAPGSSSSIRRRSIAYSDGSGWTLGTTETIGGALLSAASAPSLGWAPGRTWLGYRNFSGIGPQVSLRAAAIDSASSTWCSDVFSQVITSADTRIVVATTTSGGAPNGEIGLAVLAHGTDVYGQRVINYGNGGGYVSLGGQCGNGGTQVFSHDPGIGSSTLVCNLLGLPATALLTVFNFAPPGATLSCGPCVLTPFAVTSVQTVVGSAASVSFPIPCLPSLVGSQFETQWTTLDPAQTACPLLPGFVLSDRMLMTLGN